tara:strand:- start:592 stop:831 length:240 start_codon:yes stop_codon:yes gene_type:complete
MKVFVKTIYFLFIFLFGMMTVFAGTVPASGPPSPTGKGPPPPPGLPIDDSLYILVVVALIYGCYIVTKKQIKSKTLNLH